MVGNGPRAQSVFAYRPATNRWRRLAALPTPRRGATAVWIGGRLVVWGGEILRGAPARDGLAYEPSTDRWTVLPRSPLRARDGATVAWTGRSLIVWGGTVGTPVRDIDSAEAHGQRCDLRAERAADERGAGNVRRLTRGPV